MVCKKMHECKLHVCSVAELRCCSQHAGVQVCVGVKMTFANVKNLNLVWVIVCKASHECCTWLCR